MSSDENQAASKPSSQNVTIAIIGGLASIIVAFVTGYYSHRPSSDVGTSAPNNLHTTSQYTEQVNEFLKSQPIADYQWTGYSNDASELNSLVQHFLQELQRDQNINYSAAEPFYAALDRAAAMVSFRAYSSFDPAKEQPPSKDNYDRKVYVGPSLFEIHVEELRREHEQGNISPPRIAHYITVFNDWRNHEAGI